MSVWRVLQTVFRVAGWCGVALTLLGAVAWLSGGDPEHGTALGKILVVLGGLVAIIGLTLGHREGQATPRGPA